MQNKDINSSKSPKNDMHLYQRLVNQTDKHFKSVESENLYKILIFKNIQGCCHIFK